MRTGVSRSFPRAVAVAVGVLCFTPSLARATDDGGTPDAGPPPPAPPDSVERQFGATNVNAALGDGRLTVGVARTGEVTLLRWPGPGSPDHVRYETATQGPDGGSARALPYFGAQPDMGFFAGVVVNGATSFFRDPPWRSAQAYAADDSPVLVTTYADGAITVTQSDFVVWQQDVFVRRFAFAGLSGPTRVVVYGALAPCGQRTPLLPLDDWFYDAPATGTPVDFALFYSPADGALVSFRPRESAVDSLQGAAAQAVAAAAVGGGAAAAEVSALDSTFGPGVYLAWGASQPPSQETAAQMAFQGRQGGGPPPAFEDAAAGTLSGSAAALAPAAGALAFDLTPNGGAASLDLFLTAASGAGAALSALDAAKETGADALRAQTERAWSSLVAGFTLPDATDARTLAVAKRALMSIVTATDPPSGAVVASVTTQPPYAEDWPRDSAFIAYVLDRAGLPDRATANLQFLAKVQRTADAPGEPAGSWAMNYYPDGEAGGPIPFEIDQTALVLWAFEAHAEYLDSIGRGADAAAFRALIYPAAKRAADLLVACKDPATGLQCPANEDDDPQQTQTLDGAIPVYLGLVAASRLAGVQDQPADEAAWSARAVEIRGAILARFVDDGGMLVGNRGARGWALCPGGLFDGGDPRIDLNADEQLGELEACVSGQTPGSSYDAKNTDALAVVLRGDPARLARLRPIVGALLDQLPTATGHYGEAYLTLDGGSGPVFENVTAIPHVWEASINYLSALFFYGAKPPVPPPPPPPPAKGCGCGDPGGDGLLALFALAALRRRRALPSGTAPPILGR